MSATSSATDDAQQAVKRAANSEWADRLARLGFCARGLVYGIVGLIALQIAREGTASDEASKDGALRQIAERSFGRALLVVLAVGLAGYALWRASEAAWGKQDEEDDRKRTAKRLGSAAKAGLYAAFCVTTVRFITSGPSQGGGGDEQETTWTARVLDLPAGQLLVGAAGVAVIVGGVYLGYRGLAQKFEKRLDTADMGPVMGPAVFVVGTVGMFARGLVFAVAGFLLVKAALDFDPQKAEGVDGTLKIIARQTYGQALLTVTALGIIAFGLYSFAEARYRKL